MISKKPTKPQKNIILPDSKTFYFEHVSNKVALSHFLSWVQENVPKKATDVTISIDEEYDDYESDLNSCNIIVEWKIKMDNTHFDKQMKKHKKQLTKWKEQCQK